MYLPKNTMFLLELPFILTWITRINLFESDMNGVASVRNEIRELIEFHSEHYFCPKVENLKKRQRLVFGYDGMVKYYQEVAKNNYMVRFMLEPALARLIELLRIDKVKRKALLLRYDLAINTASNENPKDIARQYRSLVYETDNDLNLFRRWFTEVLNDLSRSNRQWIEDRMLGHRIMGASQKVVFMYSDILQRTSNFFAELSKSGNGVKADGKCALIVTSGGKDVIETAHVFGHHYEEDKHILFVTLPEENLYSLRYLFHMFHELFHYTGIRERIIREQLFIQSIYSKYASVIAGSLFNIICEDKKLADISDEVKKGYNLEFRKSISLAVKYLCENSQYYSRLHGTLKHFDKLDESQLPDMLAMILNPNDDKKMVSVRPQDRQLKDTVFNDMDSSALRIYACAMSHLHSKALYEKENGYENAFKGFDDSEIAIALNDEKYSNYVKDKVHFGNNVRIFLDRITHRFDHDDPHDDDPRTFCGYIIDLYRECYADICSLTWLDCTLAEYLNSIAPDIETFRENMPDEPVGLARVISVMNVYFFGELQSDVIEGMKENKLLCGKSKLDLRAIHIDECARVVNEKIRIALEGNIDAEDIRNLIIEYYKVYSAERELLHNPLESYLRICRDELKRAIRSKENDPFIKDILPRVRTLYKSPDDDHTMKEIMSFIHANCS